MPIEPKWISMSWLDITKKSLICKYRYKKHKNSQASICGHINGNKSIYPDATAVYEWIQKI